MQRTWSKRGTVWLLAAFCAGISAQAPQLAFTWDDLPAHGTLPAGQTRVAIMDAIVTATKAAGLPPAYGFVNGARIEKEPASAVALEHWRAAGFPLGNHAWSHMNLDQHTAAEFEADVEKNEPLLRKTANGANWHWLRYPFLAEGGDPAKRAEVRHYLQAHGYRVAAVTMSFGDYAWGDPYARCVAKNDQAGIAFLEAAYLAAADSSASASRAMSKTLYGQDIPYVLLMHVGAFDARMLPRLIELYRQRGFKFVTLEAAEQAPFYKDDLDLSAPNPITTLEGAMAARHLPIPESGPPNLDAICR